MLNWYLRPPLVVYLYETPYFIDGKGRKIPHFTPYGFHGINESSI